MRNDTKGAFGLLIAYSTTLWWRRLQAAAPRSSRGTQCYGRNQLSHNAESLDWEMSKPVRIALAMALSNIRSTKPTLKMLLDNMPISWFLSTGSCQPPFENWFCQLGVEFLLFKKLPIAGIPTLNCLNSPRIQLFRGYGSSYMGTSQRASPW